MKLVSDGIAEQAAIAGVDYTFCDSKIDAAEALACAQQFKVQGVQGVLNFQVDQASSPNICEAYGNVPTIAIDIVQPPCEVSFMGANNHEAGRLAGGGHRQVRQGHLELRVHRLRVARVDRGR